jgi:multidrug efflux pump subunit AcrB
MAVMLLSGQSINMVSLFGLIMTLGIIVDDAIVVGEHAATRRAAGADGLEAAEGGALRMLAPVVASSLTTIAAFLPLLVIGDVIGTIIRAIPFVAISVLLASLLECFLILPGHLRGAFSHQPKVESRFRRAFNVRFDRFRDGRFRRLVTVAIEWRYFTIAAALASLILCVGLLAGGRIAFNFFPSPESDVVNANVVMAAGSDRADTVAMVQELQRAARAAAARLDPEHPLIHAAVGKIGTSQGQAFGRLTGDRYGGLYLELKPSDQRAIRTQQFIQAWREEIVEQPGVIRISLNERAGGPPGREVDIRLSGGSTEALKEAALEVRALLERFPGVSDIEDDLPYGKQEVVLEVTPRGEALGFNTQTIGRQVRDAFEGAVAKRFPRGDEEVTIKVQYPRDAITTEALLNLYLRAPGGAEVPLSEVVSLRETRGFGRIRREDGHREVAVLAEIDENQTSLNILVPELIREGLPDIATKYGASYRFAGKAEEQAETLADMRLGAITGLVGIYVILAWVFASYSRPVVVMTIIPFGLIGAVLGHLLLGYDLTILSIVGLIGLSGIVVNDSIILVSTVDERLATGEAPFDAIVNGASDRLRAVLLTSLTTIGGLLPLMFETSLQAQFLIPMAITFVFGLSVATMLVLLVVPALLMIQADVARLWHGRRKPAATHPAAG